METCGNGNGTDLFALAVLRVVSFLQDLVHLQVQLLH